MSLTLNLDTVWQVVQKYKIDLEGCEIFYEPGLPDGYYGMSGENSIHLGRSAFVNEEQLVRTLIHELTHVRQHRNSTFTWAINTGKMQLLESEAYHVEDDWAELHSFKRCWKGVEY